MKERRWKMYSHDILKWFGFDYIKRLSQRFCHSLVTWSTITQLLIFYRIRLILSECYSLNLPLWLKAGTWNPRFYAELTLIIEILATQTNFFQSSGYSSVINCAQQILLIALVTLRSSSNSGSNAQRLSIPTTVILQTIAGTFHGLKCSVYMIYAP